LAPGGRRLRLGRLTAVETLAFYSYKGGVGRSLLLANAARFLASLGKSVVALDLDFEAPGLHYKLGHAAFRESRFEGGAVPYLVATAREATVPPPLEEHMFEVPVPPVSGGWLRLMPAGPAPEKPYWAALKQLGEQIRFDDPSGQGLMPLLDLHARIRKELKPDYLLIDARTGVTELGGLATTILADTVVCMFVANQESLDGTLMVAEALKAAPRLKGQRPIQVVPVLTRTTAARPAEGPFAEGVKRLLELETRAPSKTKKKEHDLFELPHDAVHGAADRIVAGERTASAFSLLYKSYLKLFRELFPSSAQRAEEALSRLEEVASIKEDLTSGRDRYEASDILAPWNASAIDEGVFYETEGYGQPDSRYADLICRDEAGRLLMAVEYLSERESFQRALEFWSKRTKIRCLVLLSRNQHGGPERNIYTRKPDEHELRPTDRQWDLPRPKEFDLLLDIGDRSIERMIDALRRGHTEAAAWLIAEWRECVAAVEGFGPQSPPWRPLRARRILDGLAATEDPNLAEQILRRAAPGEGEPWKRQRRRFHDGWGGGDELDRWIAKDLFAPLFWRLPVEAVVRYSEERHYPGESPSLAGYRLLAHDLMGLRYDPDRTALAEGRDFLARRSDDGPGEESEDREPLRWLHRSRRDRNEHLRVSEEPPSVLIWEELGREDRYFRGTLDEAKAKLGEKAKKLVTSSATLRRRLRERLDRQMVQAGGLLGQYDKEGRIEIYPSVIGSVAELIGVSPRSLKNVVFIHFAVRALAHQARDLDDQPGYGFAPTPPEPPHFRESPVHVGLAQCFAHRLIERLDDPSLMAAFEKLSQHQPKEYRQWEAMREMPLEQLRMYLLRARAAPSAIGLSNPLRAE
jgi:CobQ/CobB/MinD/ParA nucleotide binding domain